MACNNARKQHVPFDELFPILCLLSWSKRGRLYYFSMLAFILAEPANISLCTLSFCIPPIAISLFLFNAFALVRFFQVDLCVSLPWSPTSGNSTSIDLDCSCSYIANTVSELFRLTFPHLKETFQNVVWGYTSVINGETSSDLVPKS